MKTARCVTVGECFSKWTIGPHQQTVEPLQVSWGQPGENYKVKKKKEFGDVWQLQLPVFNVNFNLDHLILKIIGSEFFRHL